MPPYWENKMPCYTDPHSYCPHGIEEIDKLNCDLNKKIENLNIYREKVKEEFEELKKHSDNLTKMLCNVMIEIEYQKPELVLDNEVKKWWKKHKEWDKKRKGTKNEI